MKSMGIGQKIDLKVGFRLEAIVKDYSSKEMLVINIRFDLYYIIECLRINAQNLETIAYNKSRY